MSFGHDALLLFVYVCERGLIGGDLCQRTLLSQMSKSANIQRSFVSQVEKME